ncbi:MAG: hypothetical protein ABID54_06430 [Pseudomonadota bacterium]
MSIHPPVKVIRKARQCTFTESEVLDCLHGLIHGRYPSAFTISSQIKIKVRVERIA